MTSIQWIKWQGLMFQDRGSVQWSRTLAKSYVLESMPHISEIPWCCVIFILIKQMAKLNYLLNNKAESLC
jgi:hypothetical protein